MKEKLLNIGDEILAIFGDNNLTYGECLLIIYMLEESIKGVIKDNVVDTITSVFKEILK